jgi:hypothetical protein
MAATPLREASVGDLVGLDPHDVVWIIYRSRGSMVSGQIVSPRGNRVSRIILGKDEDEVRSRLLRATTRAAIQRTFPRATLVCVMPDEPIPEPLRRAFRLAWGSLYGG